MVSEQDHLLDRRARLHISHLALVMNAKTAQITILENGATAGD